MAAYIIVLVEEIVAPEEIDAYRRLGAPTLAEHEPEVLLRAAPAETMEGAEVKDGVVLLRFHNLAAARAWYDSPAYRQALAHRRQGARCHAVLVADAGG